MTSCGVKLRVVIGVYSLLPTIIAARRVESRIFAEQGYQSGRFLRTGGTTKPQ